MHQRLVVGRGTEHHTHRLRLHAAHPLEELQAELTFGGIGGDEGGMVFVPAIEQVSGAGFKDGTHPNALEQAPETPRASSGVQSMVKFIIIF